VQKNGRECSFNAVRVMVQDVTSQIPMNSFRRLKFYYLILYFSGFIWKCNNCIEFQLLTAVIMNVVIPCGIAPCSPYVDRRFGKTVTSIFMVEY
jgi:hypothetical protein